MPPRASGSIEEYAWRDGRTVTWRVRVRANGRRHRLDLGTNHEGWNRERAQVELDRMLAQIERGTWQPPREDRAPVIDSDETVHVTVSRWWQRREGELRPNTRLDYRWRIDHVLRHLAHEPTAELTVRRIDDFRQQLVGRGLSARSVNMVLDLLAQALDDAVEYGLLEVNPARGRRRRMRVAKPRRTFLEPDQAADLLDAAGEWEAALPDHQRYGRRALLACLLCGGFRISELTAANRGDLDLANGRLRVADAKTEAGVRDVELTAFLHDELLSHVARLRDRSPGAPLFPTRTGGRRNASNVRNRLLAGAVERANERRGDRPPLPPVTPHSLRRTFASLALAAGRDPRWVMAQMGHTDARLTLSVYAQVVQRKCVDLATVWALMRFPDEPERPVGKQSFGPTNDPTPAVEAERWA